MTTCYDALTKQADQLFGKRHPLLSLWQDIAENFYPERADFTTCRNLGSEMALNLMTSYPLLARRDLGNAMGAMLRPSQKEWFEMVSSRLDKENTEAKQWLQWASKFMRRAMYDRKSLFTRATKEADHDFATFGQAVLSVEVNKTRDGLLYRCWHLRDVAWVEDAEGRICPIYRKWKPTVADLVMLFPKTVHPKVREKMRTAPHEEVNVLHCVVPSEIYEGFDGGKKYRQPYVSCFYDTDHQHELECVGSWTTYYVIPRWQTVSGSQYAHSPATVAALPDARLLQDITRVLLEAGEKSVNPPMVATKDAIRGDISIYAGGITWVDNEYDERLGGALRPLVQDRQGLNFGAEQAADLRMQLADALYLSKLNLPPVGGPNMTAYEVGQRIQEFIRNTLPLFEPLEMDYNGQLCEVTLELLLRNSPEFARSVPRSLQGVDVTFRFQSPLREASEKIKVGQFMEAQQIIASAIQLDGAVRHLVDNKKAARDALGAAIPAEWMRTEHEVDVLAEEDAAAQDAAQAMALMQQGADVAATLKRAVPTAGVGGRSL